MNNIKKVIFFLFLLFILAFTSCIQYFTDAPALNPEKTRQLLNRVDLTGFYQSDEKSELFEKNDFEKYVNPSLGKTVLDTFNYLFVIKKSSEFIEVTQKDETYFLRYFGAFNKTILERFSMQGKRSLISGDDSISFAIRMQDDSLTLDGVSFKKADKEQLRKNKKQGNSTWIPVDTVNQKYSIWKEGNLVCFASNPKDYSGLPDTLSYVSDKGNFYLTSNKNDFYLVQKKILDRNERVFSIAKFMPSESMFSLSLMGECNKGDSCSKILSKKNIQMNEKQRIIYNENVLDLIFSDSVIHKVDYRFNKITNFKQPVEVKKVDEKSDEKSPVNLTLITVAVLGMAGIAYLFLRRNKK